MISECIPCGAAKPARRKAAHDMDGREGHIEYIDAAVKPGKGYRYRVTVKHEELLIGDEPVEGLTTRYAFVPAGLGTSSSSINE